MSDTEQAPDSPRRDAIECPRCGHVTMPNLLADGSTVCSCPAEATLSAGGEAAGMPPPVDDPDFMPGPRRIELPKDHGQFGRDTATEEFEPLRDPPR